MPKLLLLAACQKAILDQAENTLSIISLIETLTVDSPRDQEGREVVAVLPISVVSLWLREPEDEGKSFEGSLQILSPDGRQIGGGTTPFRMSHRGHRLIATLDSFPVRQEGEYRIVQRIREAGDKEEWQSVGEYPILVQHREKPTASASEENPGLDIKASSLQGHPEPPSSSSN